jgi:hypothetical protein
MDMALRSPYASPQQHDVNHSNEYKENDDRLTPTSAFPLVKHTNDGREYMKYKSSTNQIITTNDIENNNDVPSDKNSFHHVSSDVDIALFNQRNTELLSTSLDQLTNVNENENHQIISDVILPIVSKQRKEHNTTINGTFVSHIPMMSSSSSSASLSIPAPILNEQKINKSEPVVKNIDQVESLFI